jgi:hypothetical protein
MSTFRRTADWISEATGQMARRVRGMLSRRDIDHDASNGDRVRAVGREALDGSAETVEMDAFGPVGLIGRPSGNATVESAVGFVGADGSHPVALSFLDHSRRAVIDAVGLDVDETLIYTSALIVKLTRDGKIEHRTTGGTAGPLSLKSDSDALNARVSMVESSLNAFIAVYAAHTHLDPVSGSTGTPSNAATPSASSATINGTAVVMGE